MTGRWVTQGRGPYGYAQFYSSHSGICKDNEEEDGNMGPSLSGSSLWEAFAWVNTPRNPGIHRTK